MQEDMLAIGIDVAKRELVIAAVDHPEYCRTISNDTTSIKRWLAHIPAHACVAVESTGSYHELLTHLAHGQGLAVYVLNPRDVRFYAKALGRGKTDRMDAQMISRYLREQHDHLHPFAPGTSAERAVQQLMQRRERIVVHRDGLLRSLDEVAGLAAHRAVLQQQFEALLCEVDRLIAEHIASQTELNEAATRLRTIPGVGQQGAALLSCLFRRIDFTNADAVVAFSGLDPRPMDSGQKRGRRRLSKRGSPLLRRQLFMMAFSASRSHTFRAVYQALKARGLSSTEACVILGRKLLRIAFAVWRTQRPFDISLWTPKEACTEL